ncbi:3D-(3,5/4)-trihydroxycyclohexane-1,2-dione hydrolase [Murinocardiopsis flavida]|uniref:3D-(3,5/4)-trihydroxycyclohexane-1,2-dione hydrolase n=1 Tax=Murinocardiopsis flavida TaxID=645275 RepID=A0A2P8DQK9_9ACTN|nr:3D-(3,5/4)-trihydroxycyclohexane-1,2-dione acylhydrolase (decyclizing) [Murinocardiopsis flavida]PSK99505.1 3D-(3,5/4)-trihydroxycyclohexane-1,2-dione hydrolase [Murinocardiopsis flavida]
MSGETVRLTVAQALLRFLAHQYTERDGERERLIGGCWGIFGHGNVAGVGQALLESGAEMPYLQGRNEQSMVHAAVGYARQRNRRGTQAVTTSIGPGATNLVTGAALATINHLPVLLLPGDVFATRPAEPVLQQLELPHAADISVNDCLRPVSRYFDRIWRPEALIPSALRAMRVLADPAQTGAVTLALPQDVQTEAHDWPEEFFAERVWAIDRPAPDPRAVDRAAAAVRAARRPVVIAGGGVHHSGAEEALADFAAATGVPVTETQAGRGSLRHDHPQALGAVGHQGNAAANAAARDADLVIGVGTRYTDFSTASNTLFADPGVRFLNVNITGSDAAKLAADPVVADARAALTALTGALASYRVADAYRASYTDAARGWAAVAAAATAAPDPAARPGQAQVVGVLEEVAEDTDVVINAAGSLPGDLNKLWRARDVRQYHVEYGYSCMGYEIPAAIGVRLAAPDREVFALVGDGTYLMMPTEAVTAVQEGVKITVVIVQNHGYASIGGLSARSGGERFGTAYRFRAPDGTFTGDPLPLDLAANAASLGLDVYRADTVEELRTALRSARSADRPAAVYVETDPDAAGLGDEAWWDVPVAEVATRPQAVRDRDAYENQAGARRHYL